MASNRQLLEAGSARRADLVKIWIDEIHVEPDFNAPESPEEFTARVEGIALHLANGGKLPPVEVRDRAEGGVYLVDGHARRAGTYLAAERGVPVQDPKDGRIYLLTIPFVGNDADRTLRLITSAEGRTLSPLQMAAIIKRLRNFDWPVDEIAKRISRSPERVSQLLALADANTDVQQLVKSGEVSANVAIKAARKHGEGAGKVLADQLAGAKAEGKKRLTTATAEGKKVRAAELEAERARVSDLSAQVESHEDAKQRLSAMVEDLRKLLSKAMRTMKDLHEAAAPDESREGCPPVISPEAFSRFVDENAELLAAIHEGGHTLPMCLAISTEAEHV